VSRKSQVFTIVLLALVGVGFVTQLYNDAWGLLKSILIFGVIAGLLYFLMHRVLLRMAGMSGSKDKGYEKALRQQKLRNKSKKQPNAQTLFSSTSPAKLKKMNRLKPSARREHPFRVIEGKKNKTNKRTKTS
jgi:phosphate/sulfate permease